MAIIHTFRQCLNHGYLSEDATAPGQASELLASAEAKLIAAEALRAASGPDQVEITSLSYEVMFACLRALVYTKGYREAGLRCLLTACDELYVRPGQLDPAHLLAFERAQGLKAAPADNLTAARAFFERAKQLLGSTRG